MKIPVFAAFALLALAATASAQAPSGPPQAGIVADPCVGRSDATDWPNICRYRTENAALPAPRPGDPPRVVFMGDSITQGWKDKRPAFFGADGYVDRGISGQTTPQMLARFEQDVIALHPRVVHIMAATNDVAGNTGPTTLADIEANFRAMATLARANHIAVVLASTPARRSPPSTLGSGPTPPARASPTPTTPPCSPTLRAPCAPASPTTESTPPTRATPSWNPSPAARSPRR